jgi:hypothetical protein
VSTLEKVALWIAIIAGVAVIVEIGAPYINTFLNPPASTS